jgi:protein SCO1/2
MENQRKSPSYIIYAGIFIVVASLLGIGAYQTWYNPRPARILDTYGNQETDTLDEKGNPVTLTRIHKVPDFSFTDQNAREFNQRFTEGKTYVADFFFTTCQSICPGMGKEMMKLADRFSSDSSILFISHTVDPETDSVPQLKAYAAAHNARAGQWYFVTGEKKKLYDMARKGYYVTATEGDGGPDDFVHTQNFVLVDRYRQIRGYYDGTDSTEMEKLYRDILLLKDEYAWRDAGGKED